MHQPPPLTSSLFVLCLSALWGNFSHSSVGKKSICNAGDPGSIPGSGRSSGEGIGYPLQYSWASLVAQLVKNPPAKRETWVWSLGWEDPMEKGKAIHSCILARRIPWTIVHGVTKSQTGLNDFHSILISAHINYAHFNVLQSYFLRFILLPLSTLLCVNLFSLGGLLICFILVYICRASHCCQCFFEIKS